MKIKLSMEVMFSFDRKYDAIGKTAAACIKYFTASKNFWIIPLYIVFKRMM